MSRHSTNTPALHSIEYDTRSLAMKRLTPLLILMISGLCFYAGYTVGLKKAPAAIAVGQLSEKPAEGIGVTAVVPALSLSRGTTGNMQERIPASLSLTAADMVADKIVSDHEFSLRAAHKEITFTDTDGRELVASIVEATPGNLKVRRVADGRTVDLPIKMLNQTDQAFASYLVTHANTLGLVKTQGPSESTRSPNSMDDIMWESLFD